MPGEETITVEPVTNDRTRVMLKRLPRGRWALPLGFALAGSGVLAIACSEGLGGKGDESPSLSGPSAAAEGDSGFVGMSLVTPIGTQLFSATWSIAGSGGAPSYPGAAVSLGDGGIVGNIDFVVGGIAATTPGQSYTITITAYDSNNDFCTGTSGSFGVVAGGTTEVPLSVTCTVLPDSSLSTPENTGSVQVNGPITIVDAAPVQCPGIQSLTASPALVAVGQAAALSETTAGTATAINWSVSPTSGATIANATSANATFTCSLPGPYTVTASLSPCTGMPFTTLSVSINCAPNCRTAGDCPSAGNSCQQMACVSGLCQTTSVAEGTACGDAGTSICNGGGACLPFSFEVLRIGMPDGGALGTGAAPVYVEQRLVTDGGLVSSPLLLSNLGVPDASSFVLPGSNPIAGLARSANAHYLTAAGMFAPLTTAGALGTSGLPTVVARIDSSGNIDTSTQFSLAAFKSPAQIRGSVTSDGTAFWVDGTSGGGAGGVWYVAFGQSDGGAQLASTNIHLMSVYDGGLFASADDTAGTSPEIFAVGSGLPTSGSPAFTGIPGIPSVTPDAGADPWEFVFLQMSPSSGGPDTLYVANDRAVGGAGIMGVQRFQLQSGSWTQTGTLTMAPDGGVAADGGTTVGFRGLAAVQTGASQVTVIATSAETSNNRIVVFQDTFTSYSTNVVATGTGTTEYFRGVALPPHP